MIIFRKTFYIFSLLWQQYWLIILYAPVDVPYAISPTRFFKLFSIEPCFCANLIHIISALFISAVLEGPWNFSPLQLGTNLMTCAMTSRRVSCLMRCNKLPLKVLISVCSTSFPFKANNFVVTFSDKISGTPTVSGCSGQSSWFLSQ